MIKVALFKQIQLEIFFLKKKKLFETKKFFSKTYFFLEKICSFAKDLFLKNFFLPLTRKSPSA